MLINRIYLSNHWYHVKHILNNKMNWCFGIRTKTSFTIERSCWWLSVFKGCCIWFEIFRRNCVWVCSTKTSFFCNENRKWSITFLVVYVQVVVNAPEEWWWRNIWRRDICLGSLLGKRDQSYVMWVCVRDRFEDLFTGRLKTQRQSKIVTFSKFGLNLRWKLK